MERGTGRYWTEEEIKALLNVWSEKSIRKQLNGTLRNKGIFIYIAKRLQDLGVYRDWKQCRAKYKNLKYEYRTVKYAHNSGDSTKSMRFFHELDGILTPEHNTRLAQDGKGRCSAAEAQLHLDSNTGEISIALEDDDTVDDPLIFASNAEATELGPPRPVLESSSNALFIPSVANEGGKHWTLDEVRALIRLWSDRNIQRQLEGSVRNKRIFEHIAAMLQELGIDRDWKQCRTKYKNLKHEYNTVKKAHDSGNTRKTMKFFNELDTILGHKAAGQSSRLDMDEREGSMAQTDLRTENNSPGTLQQPGCCSVPQPNGHVYAGMPGDGAEEESVSSVSEDPRAIEIKKESSDVDEPPADLDEDHYGSNILEDPGIVHIKKEAIDLDEESRSSVSEDLAIPALANIALRTNVPVEAEEKNFHSHGSENPGAVYIKKDAPDIDDDSSTTSEDLAYPPDAKGMVLSGINHFRIITVGDTGAGKHWSDHEVRALIHIWSDETIQKQLEGATRNKEIFEEIANRLMEFGIDRDWKQCRTKYKNLKYEYHALQKENSQLSNPRRFMKFYEDVDCILRRQPPTAPSQISKVPNSSFAPSSSSSSEETQQVDCTLHLGSHCTGSDISVSTADKMYTSGLKRKALDNESPVPVKIKNSGSTSDLHQRSMTDEVSTKTGQMDRGVMNCGREEHSQHFSKAQLSLHPPAPHHLQIELLDSKMENITELKVGKKLNEGKTKEVYELPELPGYVLMQSKDQITAGNAARKDHMEGKAAISNKTTSCVFKLLQEAGVKTAFVRKYSDTAFVAAQCEMIPIEWVCRRIATGSFLKRHPGVKEGYKFYPPKREMFFKDDANNDPQWSAEQILAAKFNCAGLLIGQTEVDIMSRSTVAIFEILEKAWSTQDCTLVDMKIEFGVDVSKKEIVLADVIDNDSWRLWPSGDRSQQKDKQTYRDLKEVTPEAMQMVKRNFEWVAARVELLLESAHQGRVVVLMGSISDLLHCEKIKKSCANYGIPCELRVTSAHKGPDETLRIKSEYEGDGVPTVFVAVAGRSNGLGPVLSGNTAYPVVNCPPLTADWGAQDVWSSLRMPSGLGCSTVLSPEAAAQFAAQIFGLSNHLVWSKLRSSTLNTWISLKQADKKLRECSI
ncbi:bifunctional phosphoribosylaminoimidazole carboxylase/phosphoribosylaminoimidazole succinocarboxamide synthetase isoform X5 [Microcaecilia unicolor]|uniref:Uncharacterized protein LOC115461542 isoform X5 n=1 Tax=Microcaecilia unicolor TaxID=1415580 RepID=A0A6P7X9M3_9AMPH|nr:uncharacterized protein LOC115461542 isoform X5 [Microcaecilia unicolor]